MGDKKQRLIQHKLDLRVYSEMKLEKEVFKFLYG